MFGADTRTVLAALGVFAIACVFFQPQQERQMFVMMPMQQQYAAYPEVLPQQFMPSRAGMPEMNVHTGAGKGFGGGEATRDPAATVVDPNDPKGKQQAIHHAESFADYLARRNSPAAPAAAAAAPPAASGSAAAPAIKVHTGAGKGFGGGEATRDPAATLVDPNDPKGKQQAIHKAESFAEYLARRGR